MSKGVDVACWFVGLHGLVLVLGGCPARWTILSDPVVIEVSSSVKDKRARVDEGRDEHPAPPEGVEREEPTFSPPDGMADAFLERKVPEVCFGARINLHWTPECRCQGFKLDARRRMRIEYCGDAFYDEVDLTNAIDVSLVPRATVVAVGDTVRIDLVIRNKTDAVLPIMLGFALIYTLDYDQIRVVNADGMDVTRQADHGRGSRGGEVLFALHPGGEARLSMPWSPVTIVGENSGPGLWWRTEKLPPGEYTLSFKVPFISAKVTEAQRFPSAKIIALPEKSAAAND